MYEVCDHLNKVPSSIKIDFSPIDNKHLAVLCGHCDENLRQIEQYLNIEIQNRAHLFQLIGDLPAIQAAKKVLLECRNESENGKEINPHTLNLLIQEAKSSFHMPDSVPPAKKMNLTVNAKYGLIKARGKNQEQYVNDILNYDITFGLGPAGTGKTFLAVACAVTALKQDYVHRIVLVRPAVEAGEQLGFLPGTLAQKIDPYLRPLYDALYEMLGAEYVSKLLETNIIEVAPLAYMRGRTLNDAFVILDESQNTTKEQMKMFLTRIGFNSKAVITGDLSQVDLPGHTESGLEHAIRVLKKVEGIRFNYFQAKDAVRHQLVQNILEAYHRHEIGGKE